jgi:hypothetical protein
MITIQLNGRLGNQMFQYAAALALADRWQTQVRFDLTLLATSCDRFELSCFGIPPVTASTRELPIRQRPGTFRWVKKGKSLTERLLPSIRKTVLLEKDPFSFQKDFFEYSSRCYLSGYFQNESYFKTIHGKIHNAFKIDRELSSRTKALIPTIKAGATISVHARRGDYIQNREYNDFFGVCDIEYYVEACKAARGLVNSPFWVFFSDDTKWVQCSLLPALLDKQLVVDYVVVDWTGSELAFEDIYLMSLARQHIIANSTFSWWGAWLNRHACKKVFAPGRWLRNSTTSILPPEWIRITNY